jgi:hypothetical protein
MTCIVLALYSSVGNSWTSALANVPDAMVAPVTVTVDTTLDSNEPVFRVCSAAANDCSLRGAISKANADSANAYTVNLPPAIYQLTLASSGEHANANGDLDVATVAGVTIVGSGVATTTFIQAGSTTTDGIDRIFSVLQNGKLTLKQITLRYGLTSAGPGGAIHNQGTLEITDSIISRNRTLIAGGGGIYNQGGSVLIWQSNIRQNSANGPGGGIRNDQGVVALDTTIIEYNKTLTNSGFDGGGIYNSGNLTITVSSINDNDADGNGGGLFHTQGALTIVQSAFLYNIASNAGGGIYTDGKFNIQNSTISDNEANNAFDIAGGGLFLDLAAGQGVGAITNVTIADNRADSSEGGAGIYLQNAGDGITLQNTLIARNETETNAYPDIRFASNTQLTSLGNNLIGNIGMQTFTAANGDLIGTDASQIDPLLNIAEDNGGGAFTNALLAGSPAIDAGNNTACGAIGNKDQRSFPRPVDGNGDSVAICDIGAFEAASSIPMPTSTTTPTATPTATSPAGTGTPTPSPTPTATPIPPTPSSTPLPLDLDSDGDGILTSLECPNPAFCPDSDNDSVPDKDDIDSDNDGVPDFFEAGGTTPDQLLFGAHTFAQPIDTDKDGKPDHLDSDADNDSIPDGIEGNDANSDGKADNSPSLQDNDNDGLDNVFDTRIGGVGQTNAIGSSAAQQDTDGDSVADLRDSDDDGDQIPSQVEMSPALVAANLTDADKDNVPNYLDLDSDNDGARDAFEAGANPNQPIDSDGNGVADFLQFQPLRRNLLPLVSRQG